MHGIILPRPAMNLNPTPAWQTTFNSVLLSSSKGGDQYGFRIARPSFPAAGTIVDGTVDILSGAIVNEINIAGAIVNFYLSGAIPNSGWQYLFIKNKIFSRSDATFTAGTSGDRTQWAWLGDEIFLNAPENNVLLGMV